MCNDNIHLFGEADPVTIAEKHISFNYLEGIDSKYWIYQLFKVDHSFRLSV